MRVVCIAYLKKVSIHFLATFLVNWSYWKVKQHLGTKYKPKFKKKLNISIFSRHVLMLFAELFSLVSYIITIVIYKDFFGESF
jgi:hypothetical protein